MKIIGLIIFNTITAVCWCQVSISTTPGTPAASAMLDVKSNNKGVLLPRISLSSATDITTIPSPDTSLIIYNNASAGSGSNTVIPGFYSWSGSRWTRMANMVDSFAISNTYGDVFSSIPDYSFWALTDLRVPVVAIPDNDPAGITDSLYISSLNIPTIYDVEVSIRIDHPFDADLDIYLIAPDEQVIELSTDNGVSGDNYGTGVYPNYVFTTFSMLAVTPITAGSAPFIGNFLPEGNLNLLSGINGNGKWKIKVIDDAGSDIGTLIAWKISIRPVYDTKWYLIKEIPVLAKEGTGIVAQANFAATAYTEYGINTALTYSTSSSGPIGTSSILLPGSVIQNLCENRANYGITSLNSFYSYKVAMSLAGEVDAPVPGQTYYIKLWEKGPCSAVKTASLFVTRLFKN